MSSGAVLNVVIIATIVSVTLFIGWQVSGEMAASMEDANWEEEEVEVTSPDYDPYPLLDVVFIVLVGAVMVSVLSAMGGGRTTKPKQRDPVDRYKEQYIEGRLTLEEFEDRVYRVIEVEEL